MCCGRERTAAGNAIAPAAPQGRWHKAVVFEYVGNTGLTVVGPVTQTPYRFEGNGAKVRVDPRDRAGLASVKTLRQVA